MCTTAASRKPDAAITPGSAKWCTPSCVRPPSVGHSGRAGARFRGRAWARVRGTAGSRLQVCWVSKAWQRLGVARQPAHLARVFHQVPYRPVRPMGALQPALQGLPRFLPSLLRPRQQLACRPWQHAQAPDRLPYACTLSSSGRALTNTALGCRYLAGRRRPGRHRQHQQAEEERFQHAPAPPPLRGRPAMPAAMCGKMHNLASRPVSTPSQTAQKHAGNHYRRDNCKLESSESDGWVEGGLVASSKLVTSSKFTTQLLVECEGPSAHAQGRIAPSQS
jgi:hypothetical protein